MNNNTIVNKAHEYLLLEKNLEFRKRIQELPEKTIQREINAIIEEAAYE